MNPFCESRELLSQGATYVGLLMHHRENMGASP